MKILSTSLLVLSCFVLTTFAQSLFDFSSVFSFFVERARGRFKCGFPEINLRPLDPLDLPAYSVFLSDIIIAQNVNVTALNIEGLGLSKFQLTNILASVRTGALSFNVLHPELRIKGNHITKGSAKGLPFEGIGNFDITVRNVRVQPQMEFSYWPRLKIKSHTALITIESASANFTGFGSDATDPQISALLSSGGPKWVADNQEIINVELTKVVVKYVNSILGRLSNLFRIMFAMITYDGSVEC